MSATDWGELGVKGPTALPTGWILFNGNLIGATREICVQAVWCRLTRFCA